MKSLMLTVEAVRRNRARMESYATPGRQATEAVLLYESVLSAIKAGGLTTPTVKAMCRAALGEDEPVRTARFR